MTVLPDSIGILKNLESLRLDVHNVKQLPESLGKVLQRLNSRSNAGSFEDYSSIVIGGKEQALLLPKKYRSLFIFDELVDMSCKYRQKLLESYSIKQLEMRLCRAPGFLNSSKDEKEVFDNIMFQRSLKLRSKIKWTEENKQRLAKVSDEFLKAWEDGYAKAKMFANALFEKEPDIERYNVEITLRPEIHLCRESAFDDEEEAYSNWELYDAIIAYLDPNMDLTKHFTFKSIEESEKNFKKNIRICRDLSRNIEGLGDLELKDYHTCYGLHALYSHKNWAPQDLVRINKISAEVKVSYDGGEF
jgi:hypothetical protein